MPQIPQLFFTGFELAVERMIVGGRYAALAIGGAFVLYTLANPLLLP